MDSVRKLVLSIATLAILLGTGAAQARKEVTQEQYIKNLTCMKSEHSNNYCVIAVTGSR